MPYSFGMQYEQDGFGERMHQNDSVHEALDH